MKLFKLAVLEDEQDFLTELVRNLREIETINVVAYEQTAMNFIQKVRETQPDILLLDIYLKNESTTGINVAELFQLPVLFLSSERKNFLESIDNLKFENKFPVEEIGKTFDTVKLNSILKGFFPRVINHQKNQKVKVKPIGEDEILISPTEVSFILAENGNHKIYFTNRKPILIADKTFDFFNQNGFPEDKFYLFKRSYLLNISLTTFEDQVLLTPYMLDNGEKKIAKNKVPTDKRKEVKSKFLK